MNIRPYEPVSLLHRLNEDVNRLFSAQSPFLLGDRDGSSVVTSNWLPTVDLKEEADRFVLSADVPGVDPKDIEITMENGVLSIRGERKLEQEDKGEGYLRTERLYGTFHRRFTLPGNADAENVTAKSNNGVLEVVIPKRQEALPRRISVNS